MHWWKVPILLRTFPTYVFTNKNRLLLRSKTETNLKTCVKNGTKTSRQTDKAMSVKATNWSFTLNNYTDQELAMIRSMPEFVRQCLWELEQGESGTPHVQGYLRLKTQQRMSFLRSHYLSRAHYTALTTDEWKENTKKYVQKQDATAVGCVVQENQSVRTFFPSEIPELIVAEMMEITQHMFGPYERQYTLYWVYDDDVHDDVDSRKCFGELYDQAVRRLIRQHRIESLISRPEIQKIVRSFYKEISERIITQQTNAREIDRTEVSIRRILEETPCSEEAQSEQEGSSKTSETRSTSSEEVDYGSGGN